MMKQPNRDVIAYHEAGHAVMRVRIGKPLEYVDIEQATDDSDKPVLGCVDPGEPVDSQTRGDWWIDAGELLVCMAGPAAQSKYTKLSDDYHSWYDRNNAMAAIQQCSSSLTNDSPLVRFLVEAAYFQCHCLFEQDPLLWKGVESVAKALVEKGRLDKKEVKTLMRIERCGE